MFTIPEYEESLGAISMPYCGYVENGFINGLKSLSVPVGDFFAVKCIGCNMYRRCPYLTQRCRSRADH